MDRIRVLREKWEFVKNLSRAISGKIPNVEKLEYKAFQKEEWIQEFVIITFVGGAISPINVNGTSCGGILQSVARHIFGGYYDCVEMYNDYANNPEMMPIIFVY